MPESLNIEAGSKTDRGLKAYKDFIEVCLFARKETDVLKVMKSIAQNDEDVFLCQRTDIARDEWELGKIAWQNIQEYGSPTRYE